MLNIHLHCCRFGYKRAKLALKIRAIKNLCEAQFDLNAKFKVGISMPNWLVFGSLTEARIKVSK